MTSLETIADGCLQSAPESDERACVLHAASPAHGVREWLRQAREYAAGREGAADVSLQPLEENERACSRSSWPSRRRPVRRPCP